MIIKTYSTKRYFLSDEDVNTLYKAASFLVIFIIIVKNTGNMKATFRKRTIVFTTL